MDAFLQTRILSMRTFLCAALAASSLAAPSIGRADWFYDTYRMMHRDFHRNNLWPEPFNYPDRDVARAPFAVMVHNGWRVQNTLGSYHFHENSSRLTEAGQLKVHWIMTEAPPQYRTIYVERGESPEATAGRIQAIQAAAGQHLPPGAVAEVHETLVPPRGTPADQIDATARQWHNSIPAPRLPGSGGSGGGSSSGGK
jgi:hypothetical protein